ncbi:hypothetical protein [Rhodovulum kholense]|uniref:hypothetical protein n=1 Tax=Rhodovulum kholense TaxID=453584 RepID=UPI001FE8BD5B|nr:hypothetical protein [Rhodovulum kholense]
MTAVKEVQVSVDTLALTKVDADGARAAVTSEISAQFADLEALASATSYAAATADGIAAGFVFTLNGANVAQLVSVASGTEGPPVSVFVLDTMTVQSGNYVPGVSGYRLGQDGTLEIQSLIERDALKDGAITDSFEVVAMAVQSTSYDGDFLLTEMFIPEAAIAAVPGQLFAFSVVLDAAYGGVPNATDYMQNYIYVRYQLTSWADGSRWETVKSWNLEDDVGVNLNYRSIGVAGFVPVFCKGFRLQIRWAKQEDAARARIYVRNIILSAQAVAVT